MHLHIAIPAMDELEYLPHTLEAIAQSAFPHLASSIVSDNRNSPTDNEQVRQEAQCQRPYSVYICVNQPDEWWEEPGHQKVCKNNATLLRILENFSTFPLVVIDCASKGKGWRGKNHGVGWARKTLFDYILTIASPDDLLVSLDADTHFEPNYLASLLSAFHNHPQWVALAVPYYHPLTHDESINRAILRYEIYMRNYAINMLLIASPYAFTALGSAIVVRVSALSKIGSLTPFKSGEDFYLLQKLTKMGQVGSWNEEFVFPSARLSQRVVFGTGPAIVNGLNDEWDKYPLYHHSLFQKIADTYDKIDELYYHEIDTDFIQFLQQQFKRIDLWSTIRHNVKSSIQFRRAFHEKADGLRILQFLRQQQKIEGVSDLTSLMENLELFSTHHKCSKEIALQFQDTLRTLRAVSCWNELPTSSLNALRNNLQTMELSLRQNLIKTEMVRHHSQ